MYFGAEKMHRSFAPPPQQANRRLVGDPGFAQDDTQKMALSPFRITAHLCDALH